MIQGYKLSYRVDIFYVFKNICFSLQKGQALLLYGPNGSGKSSFLRILGGYVGYYRDKYENVTNDCIFLDFTKDLDQDLSVLEYVHFLGLLNNRSDFVECILYKVGLISHKDKPIYLLSSGQKRRLYVALLLISNKPIWLLDEPTTALDNVYVSHLSELVDEHLRDGGICVIATHAALALRKFSLLRFKS